MPVNSNYHTHSKYCDGYGEPEEYVLAALKKNFLYFGFSGHAPVGFPTDWTMKKRDLPAYRQSIMELIESYSNRIEIFFGLEVDYIPHELSPASPEIMNTLPDFIIGSIHFLGHLAAGEPWTVDGPLCEFEQGLIESFDGNIREAVREYYSRLNTMIRMYPPDIVGHLDIIKKNNQNSRFFSEDEKWYKDLVNESIQILSRSYCIMEINTGGIMRKICDAVYPSEWIIKLCFEQNIPITISSDAHKPEDIDGYFNETCSLLKRIGYKSYMQLTKQGWIKTDIP